MKKSILSSFSILVVTGLSFGVTLTPSIPDLGDLDHNFIYSWNIDYTVPVGYEIASASLQITNIANWDNNPNQLDIHLLPNNVDLTSSAYDYTTWPYTAWNGYKGKSGDVSWKYDAQTPTEWWDKQPGIELISYTNLTTTPVTLTYNFNTTQISALSSYALDGKLGIGFDPDCHYFNDGVKLNISTKKIPEPGIFALFGVSLLGLGFAVRRKKTR